MTTLRRLLKRFVVFVDVDGTVIRCGHLPPFDPFAPQSWRAAAVKDAGEPVLHRLFWVKAFQWLGSHIVFITARPTAMEAFTRDQLCSALGNNDFFLYTKEYENVHIGMYKAVARHTYCSSESVIPLLTIGDQPSDFFAGFAGLRIKVRTL